MSKEIKTMPHPTLTGVEVELRFRNHYECSDCEHEWNDEWDSMCDDRCPECGTTTSPSYSEDLIEDGDEFDGTYQPEIAGDGEEHF
jgi:hypothetical protein